MKYIQEQPFLDRRGHQVLMPSSTTDGERTTFEPTLKWVLYFIVDAYTPSQDMKLSNSEIRKQWKILDILEEEKELDEYFAFEDDDFNLLKKLVNYIAPMMLFKGVVQNSPILEDILGAALNKIPEEEK